MSDLSREFGRKAFHMLSLAYLGAYHWLGWPLAGRVTAGWLAVVVVIEIVRLRWPAAERLLVGFFEGMIRDTERRHFSGIFHTTVGCLGAMLVADGRGTLVTAAILQLALADAASALAGKAFGRRRLFGGQKTLEGSLAGLAVGFASARACGFGPGASLAAALAGSIVEVMPTTPWFNDNMWIPVAAAAALRLAAP